MIKKIPLINEITCNEKDNKFIQLKVNGKNYLRFNSNKEKNHSQLLYNTLAYEFNILPKFIRIGVASPKGHNYELTGTGKFKKQDEKIILYETSFDYFIWPNQENAKEISQLTGLELITRRFLDSS